MQPRCATPACSGRADTLTALSGSSFHEINLGVTVSVSMLPRASWCDLDPSDARRSNRDTATSGFPQDFSPMARVPPTLSSHSRTKFMWLLHNLREIHTAARNSLKRPQRACSPVMPCIARQHTLISHYITRFRQITL